MQIARIFYPVKTLGPGRRIGLWTVGCPHHCYGCSNPELWEPEPNKNIPLEAIKDTLLNIMDVKNPVDGITISGGEPFLQSEELSGLISFMKDNVSKDILVYTGYTIEELRAARNKFFNAVLNGISVLIDGPYMDELNDNIGIRGSSNQRVFIFDPGVRQRYKTAMTQRRMAQNVHYEGGVISFGIPLKDYRSNISQNLRKKGVHYE